MTRKITDAVGLQIELWRSHPRGLPVAVAMDLRSLTVLKMRNELRPLGGKKLEKTSSILGCKST